MEEGAGVDDTEMEIAFFSQQMETEGESGLCCAYCLDNYEVRAEGRMTIGITLGGVSS